MHVGSVSARAVDERRDSIANREATQLETLPELFARQAALTPLAPAIVCDDRVLTYRELDVASNRLANHLRRAKLAPQSRIAVLLDRSPDLVIALLGVLKAGSAYIPLDPTYPAERLAYVWSDARPTAVISKSTLLDSFAIDSPPSVLFDRDHALLESSDGKNNFANTIDPHSVAYVIYTSGSTGRPKGVQIQHRSLANLLLSMRERPGLSATDVLLAVTTISFDIAALELFLPLIVGAKIVLALEKDVTNGAALCRLLQRHSVTALQATPITWQLVLGAGWQGNARLKMLCGGEALSRKLADELLARGGELWNLYGPTETTVWSSAMRVTKGDGPVLLGPPIANTRFYLLDEQLQPVTSGEPGELFIGGDGVALGYVNLPELTAEKFLLDPFSPAPNARLYRTGDIVRVRQYEGQDCLEFLGRADTQIKLRGHRIELGEIEATLLRHPDVAQAVAIVGRRKESEPIIWAYVILRSKLAVLSVKLLAELRAVLHKFLPAYMHPAAITALAEFPKTPNGKVDRKALPEPEVATASTELRTSESLRENAEERLLAIWTSLLGLDSFPRNGNFFTLGGTSLLAAQLLDRIEAEFDVRLSLSALFAAPTITAQAQLLRAWVGGDYDFRQMVRLHGSGSKKPLLVIHNTGVYCYHLAQLLGPDQPLIALQLFDPSPREIFPTTVEDIAAEYIELIRRAQPQGPYRLLGWCVGGVIAFEIARQFTAQNETVSFLGMIDSWSPGNRQRMSKLSAWLADHSFRIQLILGDWRRTRESGKSITDFLRRRSAFKKLLGVSDEAQARTLEEMFAERHRSGVHYDRWLTRYLDEITDHYTPQPYGEKVMLLRSAREPSGWFLDPLMGWREFIPAGIDTVMIEGDHFTMFRGNGLQQLAQTLSSALDS